LFPDLGQRRVAVQAAFAVGGPVGRVHVLLAVMAVYECRHVVLLFALLFCLSRRVMGGCPFDFRLLWTYPRTGGRTFAVLWLKKIEKSFPGRRWCGC
jgi:hypothetical protein